MRNHVANAWENPVPPTRGLATEPVEVDISATIAEAEEALEAMRPRRAIEILWRAVEAAPTVSELRYNLGIAQQVAGLPAAAAASYRTALILEPTSLPAMGGLTSALEELGEWREADTMRSVAGLTLPVLHRVPGAAEGTVALTIDDGPSPDSTPGLLEALKRANARASFFVVGVRAERHPELVQAMVDGGHDVLNHGYSHNRLDDGRCNPVLELARTEAVLSPYRARPSPNYVRVPFGSGWESPHLHRQIAAWSQDAVVVQFARYFYEWSFVTACKNKYEVKRACRAAVEEGLMIPPPAGTIFLTHDHPYASTEPLAPFASVALVEELLRGLAARKLRAESLTRIAAAQS